jgi:hypothetical protein
MTAIKKTADPAANTRRKPYAPPKLVSYGHVKDVVQGSQGGMSDDPSTTKMCRVAEALYGADDPRTLLLRGWFVAVHAQKRHGWRLVAMYRRCGPTVAGLLQTARLPRRPFLLLFDFLAGQAFSRWARIVKDERHHRAV